MMLNVKAHSRRSKYLGLAIWASLCLSTHAEEPVISGESPWWSKAGVSMEPAASKDVEGKDSASVTPSEPVRAASVVSPFRMVPPSPNMPSDKGWGVHFKLGLSKPDLGDWSKYYGSSSMNSYQFGVQYAIKYGWSLRATISQMTAEGFGRLLSTGANGASVEYTFRPVQLGLVYEFFRSSKSFVKPFVSLGYTYATYEQNITDQPSIKGHVDGSYFGGGLIFNLFPFDRGVKGQGGNFDNVCWILDVEKSIMKSNVDLGALNYQLGLQVRF